ncbi:MAG: hypothetical protein ABID54_10425 [Pseudomonadota bacterium]
MEVETKGWAVLTKCDYFDWSISVVYTKDSNVSPKLNCKEWIERTKKACPGVFQFKIKPCKVVL